MDTAELPEASAVEDKNPFVADPADREVVGFDNAGAVHHNATLVADTAVDADSDTTVAAAGVVDDAAIVAVAAVAVAAVVVADSIVPVFAVVVVVAAAAAAAARTVPDPILLPSEVFR